MATRPAFQFYATDWRSDPYVSLMSLEEEGAYIRLLAFAWLSDGDGIPVDDRGRAAVLKVPEKKAAALWKTLARHWEPNADGTGLVNPRQEKQRQEYDELVEKRRKAGLASAAARANTDPNTGATHD